MTTTSLEPQGGAASRAAPSATRKGWPKETAAGTSFRPRGRGRPRKDASAKIHQDASGKPSKSPVRAYVMPLPGTGVGFPAKTDRLPRKYGRDPKNGGHGSAKFFPFGAHGAAAGGPPSERPIDGSGGACFPPRGNLGQPRSSSGNGTGNAHRLSPGIQGVSGSGTIDGSSIGNSVSSPRNGSGAMVKECSPAARGANGEASGDMGGHVTPDGGDEGLGSFWRSGFDGPTESGGSGGGADPPARGNGDACQAVGPGKSSAAPLNVKIEPSSGTTT